MKDRPALDVERTDSTPGRPFIAVSSGKVMSCSTSSAAMPPASVKTVTVGLFRSGKTSTGMRDSVNRPYATSTRPAMRTSSRLARLASSSHLNMRLP
jgi:hypothetical protein